MRDRGIILAGLAIFLGAITFPVWYNLAGGQTSKGPELKKPAGVANCVQPVSYMRTSHMDLLVTWREDVVRRGIRSYRAFDGKTYRMSLSRTCLAECHGARAEFCDRCHNYAGMQPYCWDCHVDAKQLVQRSRR